MIQGVVQLLDGAEAELPRLHQQQRVAGQLHIRVATPTRHAQRFQQTHRAAGVTIVIPAPEVRGCELGAGATQEADRLSLEPA